MNLKVTLKPLKEIIINQIVKVDVERLTKFQVISEDSLCWCNRLLFFIRGFDDEYFSKKQSNGIWHIDSFVYSKCEEKPDFLKCNGFQVEILDFTNFSVIEELTKSISKLEFENR